MASRGLGSLTLDLIAKIGGFVGPMNQAERAASKSMTNIEKRANAFGKSIGKSIRSAATQLIAFTGVTVTVGAALESLKGAIDLADETRDLSIRLGTTTETISEFRYAAQQTGTDMDALGKGMKLLAKNAAAALNPTSAQAKIFAALGVSVTDASGNLKNLSDLVPEIADKFKALEDGTTKAALAQALFGKSGLELTEFLNQGADGLQTMADKARALGIVINQETAAAADKFNDDLSDLKAAAGGLALQVAQELLPAIDDLVIGMKAFVSDGDNAKEIAHGVADGFRDMRDAGVAIGDALDVLQGLRTVLNGLQDQASAVTEGIKSVLSGNIGGVNEMMRRYREASAEVDAGFRGEKYNRERGSQFQNVIGGSRGNVFDNVVGSTDSVSAGSKADERRLALALSNPSAPKAGKSPRAAQLTDEQREAAKLLESYKQLTETYNQQIALVGQTSDVAKLRYDLENGELAKLNPQQKDLLLTLAQTAEQREKDYEALQKQIDLEATQTENAKQVLADIAAERDLLGATIEQQDTYNKLKYAGVKANSEWGQSIIEANHALHEQAKQMAASIEIQDEWRSGLEDAITSIVTGTKSLKEAFTDLLDNFAAMVTQMIAKKWVAQLFGESGSNGGGSMGGWMSMFAGLFGGGKAGGGSVAPGKIYEVGEGDRPEMLMMRGRQYMIPGNHGTVVPIRGNAGGGAVSQSLNFYYAAPPDPRTQAQTAQRVGFETNRATSRNR